MRVTVGLLPIASIVGAAAVSLVLSAQSPRSQWSGVYTVEQADRGAKTFQLRCSPCHAKDATGGTYGGDVGRGPALIGRDFSTNWDNATLAELFDVIHDTMPLDNPGSLSNEEVADVIGLILKLGGYPAGMNDLPADKDLLSDYRFLAKDPGVAK
jgi:mono/diheme cytochrome c family protein